MKYLLCTLAALTLTACGSDSGTGSASSAQATKVTSVTEIVQGELAADYYSRFVFARSGSCAEQNTSYVSTESRYTKVGEGERNSLLAQIRMHLLPDNTYRGIYSVVEGSLLNEGFYVTGPIRQEVVIQGNWEVKEGKIEISGLGTGSGMEINEVKGFDLRLADDHPIEAIAGKALFFEAKQSYPPLFPDLATAKCNQ